VTAMLYVRRLLQEADRRITEWRTLIARQKRRIAEMQKGGYSAAGSITLLREMEVSLNSMRDERKVIERRIEWHRRLIRETELYLACPTDQFSVSAVSVVLRAEDERARSSPSLASLRPGRPCHLARRAQRP
jgi:hypothetical protein